MLFDLGTLNWYETLDSKIEETYPSTNPLFHYVCLRKQIHMELTNQNYVRTLANLQLSFIKVYVLLNSAWFLYFFFTVVGFGLPTIQLLFTILAYDGLLWWCTRKLQVACIRVFYVQENKEGRTPQTFHKFLEARSGQNLHYCFMKSLVTSVKK